MARFYFTYGSDSSSQPYNGGWTEVEADDEDMAREAFCLVHPRKDGFIPCCSIYSEAQFAVSKMAKTGENFGVGCRERITLTREVLVE